jgi:hypothetical protein
MRMGTGILIAGCVFLAACETTGQPPTTETSYTPAAPSDSVRVVGASSEVVNCAYLTDVRGDQNIYGGIFAGAAYQDAINQMKRKTAAAGGNTLFVISATSGWAGANAIGNAYRC